jgi:hypothetical protein
MSEVSVYRTNKVADWQKNQFFVYLIPDLES